MLDLRPRLCPTSKISLPDTLSLSHLRISPNIKQSVEFMLLSAQISLVDPVCASADCFGRDQSLVDSAFSLRSLAVQFHQSPMSLLNLTKTNWCEVGELYLCPEPLPSATRGVWKQSPQPLLLFGTLSLSMMPSNSTI